jgi:4-amino-4-deoxy-L-arabinose transferase-like glycosyltransferase
VSVWLVFVIARQLFDVRTALLAACVYAVFPNPVFYVGVMQVETLFVALFLGAVAVLVTHDWSSGAPSRRRMLAFGALLGASALVRPFGIPLLVGVAVVFLVAGYGWRRTLAGAGWAALASVVVLAPWLIRNEVRMHAPVLSTNMGDTVVIDRYEGTNGRFRYVPPLTGIPEADREVRQNSEFIGRAITFVREHPTTEAHLIGKRLWYMMQSDHEGLDAAEGIGADPFLGHRVRRLLTDTADVFFFVALVLAVVGLPCLFRRGRPDRWVVAAAVVALLGVPMLLWGNPRFHAPLLPFVSVLAGVTLVGVYARVRGEAGAAR